MNNFYTNLLSNAKWSGWKGLSNYWSFDNYSDTTLYDDYSSYNGTASNSRVFGINGKNNKCADFTQGDDVINLSNDIGVNFVEHSCSFWIKKSSISAEEYIMGEFNYATANGQWYGLLIRSTGYLTVGIRQDLGTSNKRLSAEINFNSFLDGNWHHVFYKIKGSDNTLNIYVDGVERTKSSVIQTNPTSFDDWLYDLNLGCRNNAGTLISYFNGYIDEMCYFNRLLTEEEIERIYNNGNGKFY